jgi:hypothetical protein
MATITGISASAEEAVMSSAPRPSTAAPNRLGIRVVWENAFFGPEERAAIEEVLAAILADGLIEAFTRSRPSDPTPARSPCGAGSPPSPTARSDGHTTRP